MKITPRLRPKVTSGITAEIKTGCGTLYVTINSDEHGPVEVFLRLGKSGGCGAAQTEAIGKLVSLCLACGIEIEEIARKLKGIRCPSSCFYDGNTVTSCADAVAKVLEQFTEKKLEKSANGTKKLEEFAEGSE